MPKEDSARDVRAVRAQSFLRWGVAKLVKAPDFDSGIRGFESFLPSHLTPLGRAEARRSQAQRAGEPYFPSM
jgi:hypothetical protein